MCLAVALITDEVPTDLQGRPQVARRLHRRGDRPEYRFDFRDPFPRLVIRRDGRVALARWGNIRGQSRHLPRTAWTWKGSIRDGAWRHTRAIKVDILASYALDGRGVWYPVFVGIRGILVPDENNRAVAYMVCEPATYQYRTRTGSDRMPVLIDQTN